MCGGEEEGSTGCQWEGEKSVVCRCMVSGLWGRADVSSRCQEGLTEGQEGLTKGEAGGSDEGGGKRRRKCKSGGLGPACPPSASEMLLPSETVVSRIILALSFFSSVTGSQT